MLMAFRLCRTAGMGSCEVGPCGMMTAPLPLAGVESWTRPKSIDDVGPEECATAGEEGSLVEEWERLGKDSV